MHTWLAIAEFLRGNAPITKAGFGIVFTSVYLLAQLALPLWGLTIDRQTRFSWKMFIWGNGSAPRFIVLFANGRREELDELNKSTPIALIRRPEVDSARFVPPHLCRVVPGATKIIVLVENREAEHPC